MQFDQYKAQMRSIGSISLVGAIGAFLVALVCATASSLTNAPHFLQLAGLAAALGISYLIAFVLNRRGGTYLATWIAAFVPLIVSFFSIFLVANLAQILIIVLPCIVILIAWQALPTGQGILVSLAGVASSIGIYLVNQSLLNDTSRLPAPLWLQDTLIAVGGITIMILAINLMRRFEFSSIRTQMAVAFIIIALTPIIIISSLQFLNTGSNLQDASYRALAVGGHHIQNELDQDIDSLKQQVVLAAGSPVITTFLAGDKSSQTQYLASQTLRELVGQNQFLISSEVLDQNGNVAIGENPVISQEIRTSASQVLDSGSPFVSDVLYDASRNNFVFYIIAPSYGPSGQKLGTVFAELNADLFQSSVISETRTLLGNGYTTFLISQDGVVLADTSASTERYTLIAPVANKAFASLVSQEKLTPDTVNSPLPSLEDLGMKLASLQSSTPTLVSLNGESNLAVASSLETQPWTLIVTQPEEVVLAPFQGDIFVSILMAIIIALTALATATLTSSMITSPLDQLVKAARQIGAGDLDIITAIQRRDEIGDLSSAIDQTTSELRSVLANLERRVEERTSELSLANETIAKRLNQLRSISEISRSITSLKDINQLLSEITLLISQTFKYYHVGIFLLDPSGENAILRAANSEGGRRMLKKGHRLKVGQVGIVGYVTGSGRPRVAMNVGEDAVFFNNPDLPETRSELALPLKINDKIIGALDVQSIETGAFADEDVEVLGLLAEQVAVAVQNARLYTDARTSLAESQLLYRSTVESSWKEFARQDISGYRYINGIIEELHASSQAVAKLDGKSQTKMLSPDVAENNVLQIPITIRGETLGTLNIQQRERDYPWGDEEIRMFQAIVDRLSFALENARLYSDAERQAAKERVISDISTKIGASVSMENIMQTAVEELGRALPGSEILIQFQSQKDLKQGKK